MDWHRCARTAWIVWASAVSAHAFAASSGETLKHRLDDVISRLDAAPQDVGSAFAKRFNDKVRESQGRELFVDLHSKVGGCRPLATSSGQSPSTASFILRCERGYVLINLSVEEAGPGLIDGLFIRGIFE